MQSVGLKICAESFSEGFHDVVVYFSSIWVQNSFFALALSHFLAFVTMPAPPCESCGSLLNIKWGRDAAGNKRPRSEWQCPKHGTILTCAKCCPQCPQTGWGGSSSRGKKVVAKAEPAGASLPASSASSAPPEISTARRDGRGDADSSRSPRGLRITPAQLEERMRSQHRFLAGRGEWPLELSWKYGSRASTWAEAVGDSLTTWWLRRLDDGVVRSVKLKIFLQWARQQRREQCERESSRQQQLHQQQQVAERLRDNSGCSSEGSGRMQFSVPPCVVCLEARPTQLCVPCHHLCLCEVCSLQLLQDDDARCPVCRGVLDSFVTAFY